jgi:hypothetical protein
MNTEYLIQVLIADGSRPVVPIARTLARALGLAIIVALLFLFVRRPRVNLFQAFTTAPFDFKITLLLSLAGTSALLLMDTARPVLPLRRPWFLMLAPLLLAGGLLVELAAVPSRAWRAHLIGHNAAYCLTFIPLISLAPLACLLFALRRAAPKHPALAGAAAGLLAAGVAGSVYALTCPDDSPLFIATWYSAAVALVTGSSACIGSRLLRW